MNPTTGVSKHTLRDSLNATQAASEKIVHRLPPPNSWYLREGETNDGTQVRERITI